MKKEGLWAQSSQLHFTSQQLKHLNVYFSNMEICQDLKHNQTLSMVEENIENLMQYVSNMIGYLDSRFSSEFLIRLEPVKTFVKGSNCLSYLIHLDNLSIPNLSHDDGKSSSNREQFVNLHVEYGTERIPAGFGKIKVDDEFSFNKMREFVTKNGFLRRDKIQKKYIELLKKVVSSKVMENIETNTNSILSGSPGKILDAETLYHVLNIPPEERIFYGSSKETKMSAEIRKYRIEVMESNHLIKLRFSFLSEDILLDESIDVILLLGVRLQGWPSTCDYPHRISFCNCDILLHQQMATTSFSLISASPPALPNDNKKRSTLWQFFFPTIDNVLVNHYSELSCVLRTINIVYIVMLNLRRTTHGGHTVGKYVIKILTWLRIENSNEFSYWISDFLSYHVISILDDLVNCLRNQNCRSYFFEGYNALKNSFRSVLGHFSSNDYVDDANIIETFIHRIHALSSSELIGHQMMNGGDRRVNQSSNYEAILIQKWGNLLSSMVKSCNANKKGITFIRQQIEYIIFLFRGLLITKSIILPCKNSRIDEMYPPIDYSKRILPDEGSKSTLVSVEDICYVITLFCDHAKRHFLSRQKRSSSLDDKSKTQYQEMVHLAISRVRENPLYVIRSELHAITLILQTLYETAATSKTSRSILDPYLKTFFLKTHENCWFLEEWKNRIRNDELVALRLFSKMVNRDNVHCKDGLLDALQKNWDWALNTFKVCSKMKNGQNLIFMSRDGTTIEYCLVLSEEETEQATRHQLNTLNHSGYRNAVKELCGILRFDDTCEYAGEDVAEYYELRDSSPISRIVDNNRRRGFHLGLGNIVFSLVALGKFTILQQITEILPEEKRHRTLENIQRAAKLKQRASNKEREKYFKVDEKEMYKIHPESNGGTMSRSVGLGGKKASFCLQQRRRPDLASFIRSNGVAPHKKIPQTSAICPQGSYVPMWQNSTPSEYLSLRVDPSPATTEDEEIETCSTRV